MAAMAAATAVFVIGDVFMKLVTEALPPFEVLFLRGLAASAAAALWVALRGDGHMIASALHGRVLLRAAAETFSVLCYIVALARMPIADVIAILQTAPLLVIVAAAVLLREPVGATRMALVLLGFAGALMVAQPTAAGVSSAVLLAFATAVLIAARDLIGRTVPADCPVTVMVLATNVMVTAGAAAMSLASERWVAPDALHLAHLGAAGLLVTLGHAGVLLAYRVGRPAAVAPFFYSFALWGLVAGVLVWGVWPNALALAGLALIVASGVAIVVGGRSPGRGVGERERA
ncbi:DMT family transporter [Piscinibacter defluvii]|uniref:DMT family transporter n=1 Tax=Piscinibacter defluvii TaxID=1796922 RepID=UPI000FDE5973|nr:DMT family transporter [Piscinibacter defluvii]